MCGHWNNESYYVDGPGMSSHVHAYVRTYNMENVTIFLSRNMEGGQCTTFLFYVESFGRLLKYFLSIKSVTVLQLCFMGPQSPFITGKFWMNVLWYVVHYKRSILSQLQNRFPIVGFIDFSLTQSCNFDIPNTSLHLKKWTFNSSIYLLVILRCAILLITRRHLLSKSFHIIEAKPPQ